MKDLERSLVALGRALDVPDAPDLAADLLGALEKATGRPVRASWALAVALALLAVLVAALSIPEARSALLRVLRICSERIEFVDQLPAVPPNPAELDLGAALGERVSLVEARRRAEFDLRELPDAPDHVYVGSRGTVWFLYGTGERVRLLVAQTARLRVDDALILKKLVSPATRVDPLTVAGNPGFFISGEPHVVLLLDGRGEPVEETARLAQNVLVWTDDGTTIRLEGRFTRGEALHFAESLR